MEAVSHIVSTTSLKRRNSFGTIKRSTMLLRDKYELGPVIKEGDVRTVSARELPQGSPVMIHELVTSIAQLDVVPRVVKHLQRAPAGARTGILDMFEIEGRVYLVTSELPAFTGLRDWLASCSEAQAASIAEASGLAQVPVPSASMPSTAPARPATPPMPTGGAPSSAGEFTLLFQGLDRPPGAPAAGDSLFGEPAPAAKPPAPAHDSAQPAGGFTQVFESPACRPSRMELSAPHFPLSGQPSGKSEPGEFTRLLDQGSNIALGGGTEASFQIEKLSTSTGSGGQALVLGSGAGSTAGPEIRMARSDRAARAEDASFTEVFGVRPSTPGPAISGSVPNQAAAEPHPPATVPAPPPSSDFQTRPAPSPPVKQQSFQPPPVQPEVAPAAVKVPSSLSRPPVRPPAPPAPPPRPPQLKTPAVPAADIVKPMGQMPRAESGIPMLPLVLILGGVVLLIGAVVVGLLIK